MCLALSWVLARPTMNMTDFWSLISWSLQSNNVTSGQLLNLSELYFSSSSEDWK